MSKSLNKKRRYPKRLKLKYLANKIRAIKPKLSGVEDLLKKFGKK
jgi:hypothetical protein